MFNPPKRLERRETFGSPIMPYGAQDSVGRPHRVSGESESETHEVWVHAVRLGGRHRSDASRVFHTGRSQGLTVARRALARKKSAAPPDAERGWKEGETVREYEISNKFSRARPAGLSLAGSRYEGRRSRAHARLAFTGRTKQSPSGLQVQIRFTIREERE
jgi:hypothetical protein